MSAGSPGAGREWRTSSTELLAVIDRAFDAQAAARERVRAAEVDLAAARGAFTEAIWRAHKAGVPYFVIAEEAGQ